MDHLPVSETLWGLIVVNAFGVVTLIVKEVLAHMKEKQKHQWDIERIREEKQQRDLIEKKLDVNTEITKEAASQAAQAAGTPPSEAMKQINEKFDALFEKHTRDESE